MSPWVVGAVILAALGFLPKPLETVDLRKACPLQSAGRFGVSCDLPSESNTWPNSSFVVFEDEVPLRDVAASRQVRKQGLGAYALEEQTLWFSSIDGSSPIENGREYQARIVPDTIGVLGPAGRGVALALAVLAMGIAIHRAGSGAGYQIAMAVTVLALVIQVYSALTRSVVHVDAGFLLPYAREIMDGRVPYRDFLYNYTPIGVMTLAGWMQFGPPSGLAAHTFALGLVLVLEALCAWQVFAIARALRVRPALASVCALSYLSLFMSFDGSRMLFEPMYLLAVLTALRIQVTSSSDRSSMGAGALASFAFLIKQYGGFALWGALFASLSRPRPLVSAVRVVLGAAASLALVCVGLFSLGVDLRLLASQVLFSNYPARWETVWIRLFFEAAPFLLLGPILFVRREWRAQPGIPLLLGYLIASWMPLLVRQHQYYLQNPSPFLFLTFAALASLMVASARPDRSRWIEMAALLCLVSIPVRAAQQFRELPAVRGAQERRARLMTSFWPVGQPVLMFADPSFLALTGYRSPDLGEVGYRFLYEAPLDKVRAGMRRATAAWIDPNSMYARGDFARAESSLERELEEHGFVFQMKLEDRYELWTKGGVAPAREPPAPIEGK